MTLTIASGNLLIRANSGTYWDGEKWIECRKGALRFSNRDQLPDTLPYGGGTLQSNDGIGFYYTDKDNQEKAKAVR